MISFAAFAFASVHGKPFPARALLGAVEDSCLAGHQFLRPPAKAGAQGSAGALRAQRPGSRPFAGKLHVAHRSTSPNTTSIAHSTAVVSASMWPFIMKSIAWRWLNPVGRILQR